MVNKSLGEDKTGIELASLLVNILRLLIIISCGSIIEV
jgi:hypothetical protein